MAQWVKDLVLSLAMALVTTVAQVPSPAQELPRAVGGAKKKKRTHLPDALIVCKTLR